VVDATTGAQMTAVLDPNAGTLTNASTGESIDPTKILVVDPSSGDLIDPVSGKTVDASTGQSTDSSTPSTSTTPTGDPSTTPDTATSSSLGGAPTSDVDTSYVQGVIDQVQQEHDSGTDPNTDSYTQYPAPEDPKALDPKTMNPGPYAPVPEDPKTTVPDDQVQQLLRCMCCDTDGSDKAPKKTPKPEPKPGTVPADCDTSEPKGGKVTQSDDGCAEAPQHYTVRCGDSLSSIAKRFDTTWRAIYRENKGKIDDPNMIYPGERLRIPEGCDMPPQSSKPAPKPPKPGTVPADCDMPGQTKPHANPPKPPHGPPNAPPPGQGGKPPTNPPKPPGPPPGGTYPPAPPEMGPMSSGPSVKELAAG
jgi:LysM repeat protein